MPDTAKLENRTSEADRIASNPSSQPVDRLISVQEFVDSQGLNKVSVYALIRRGKIPAVHIGRSVRISTRTLNNWIAAGGCR